MTDIAVAFALILIAELGDKTQLVALTTATRHGAVRTLAVLTVALVVLQTLSVTAGAAVSSAIPDRTTAIVAGLLFLAFGAWTWRTGVDGPAEQSGGHVRLSLARAALAFFIAEVGDKTMLSSAALAADRGVVVVWIGSLAAMVTATAVAVLSGRALARRISVAILSRVGAVGFILVGVATLATSV
ncbi:MAG: TMEM165/GDT1 family protein [Actinomycetota bacterium]